MIRFLLDEHVPRRLIPGLRAREPAIDIARIQDVGLRSADDPALLEWAFSEGRTVISRDKKTLIGHAYDRLACGLSFAGMVMYRRDITSAQMIESILLIHGVYDADSIRDQVIYIPL